MYQAFSSPEKAWLREARTRAHATAPRVCTLVPFITLGNSAGVGVVVYVKCSTWLKVYMYLGELHDYLETHDFIPTIYILGDEILHTGDIAKILDELLPAQTKSYYVGLALNVPSHEVDAINLESISQKDRLCKVLLKFLERTEPTATWKVITAALRKPMVGLQWLAQEIEQKYCLPSPGQCVSLGKYYYR